MRHLRKRYYDAFAGYYDRFVAFHSRDARDGLRSFLSGRVPVQEGDFVLDICTGTGTLLGFLRQKVGPTGLVVGLDFSPGMLKVCKMKVGKHADIALLQSDAARLPFKDNCFSALTCSHAFYELKGKTQQQMLREAARVLKPGKPLFIMEHDLPENPLIRMLLYIRLLSMGTRQAVTTLRHEKEVLQKHFAHVEKVTTPGRRSKIMVCRN